MAGSFKLWKSLQIAFHQRSLQQRLIGGVGTATSANAYASQANSNSM